MNERDKDIVNQASQQRLGWQDDYINIPVLIDLIRADEREACAKWADDDSLSRREIAKAIRARGNT